VRIGKVVGRVTLSQAYKTLYGGRYVIVEVQDRFALSGEARKTTEYLVSYDNLGASDGDLIAFTESREACMPFYPEKLVPLDAYNAAILDHVQITHEIQV
jgi:microcompartment protein CcmK/EutM